MGTKGGDEWGGSRLGTQGQWALSLVFTSIWFFVFLEEAWTKGGVGREGREDRIWALDGEWAASSQLPAPTTTGALCQPLGSLSAPLFSCSIVRDAEVGDSVEETVPQSQGRGRSWRGGLPGAGADPGSPG